MFDKHNRGYITASDLRAVLHCLGEDLSEEESEWRHLLFTIAILYIIDNCINYLFFCSFSVEDMIKEVDVDGDGRIDFYGNFYLLTRLIPYVSKYSNYSFFFRIRERSRGARDGG